MARTFGFVHTQSPENGAWAPGPGCETIENTGEATMRKVEKRFYEGGIVAAAGAVMFFMIGCGGGGTLVPGKVTGGGWVETPDGGKANFGFTASACGESATPKGQFNFHDMTHAGGAVKMQGTLSDVGQCVNGECVEPDSGISCPANSYIFKVKYRSTNPKLSGSGEAAACVADHGEGSKGQADVVAFKVTTGPFTGYEISGTAKGNIQAHDCKE